MTWLTNSVTWVHCDDERHAGQPDVLVETGYSYSARQAMITQGWGYQHERGVHICPTCVARNINEPLGGPSWAKRSLN